MAAGFLSPFVWWEDETDDQHRATWSSGGDPLSLLDVLAAEPYERIRLVSLVPLAEQVSESISGLPELMARVEHSVARRLAKGQRLYKVGVLVPATGVSAVPRSVLSNRWDSTVVVVDEDSVDPLHASREVRDAGHFAEHAMLALATVGGLWTGMDGAPFDGDSEGAGQQEPRVRLVRCHARAARSYGLSDEIVREALTRREDPVWAADMADAVSADDGDHLAVRAAAEYLEGPGQRLQHIPFRPPRRKPMRINPGQAYRLLWLFMRGRIKELREELRTRATNELYDRIERFTQRLVFGQDTDFIVRFDGRPLSDKEGGTIDLDSVELAQALLDAVKRPSASRAFSEEWQALRELAFGLVDAGPLPDECTEPGSGVHRQVVAVRSVSPAPAALADGTAEDQQAIDQSFVARVGRRIQSDADATRQGFMLALQRLKRSLPGRPEEPPVDRGYWYWWLAVTGFTMLGLLTTVVLALSGSFDLGTATRAGLALVLLFVVGSAVILFLYLKKEFQDAHKSNHIWYEYEEARLAAEHEAEELIRLVAANAEYRDWAVILARMLYLAGQEAVATPPDGTDLATLPRPSALGVAATETDPRLLTRLAAIIGRRSFHTGWISGLYARVTEGSMAELKFRRGLPAAGANPDPDTEGLARVELGERLRDGLADDTLIADIRSIIAEQTAHLRLAELFCAVHPVGGDPVEPAEFLSALEDATGEKSARFNRRLWTGASGYPAVSTSTRTWLPDRLASELGATPTATLTVTLSPNISVITVQSARLDLTEPIVWSDLTVFMSEQHEIEVPATGSEQLDSVW